MKRYTPLIYITILEALIGIWVKLAGNSIPIFTINFYRALFALLSIFLVFILINRKGLKLKKVDIIPSIIIGFLIACQISLFNIAMNLTSVANVVIFWSTYPFFVFILSALFLDEKVRRTHIFIFILGIIGIVIAEPLKGDQGSMVGNVISLFGGFVFASLVTYIRKEESTESSGGSFWFFFFATIFLTPMIFIFGIGDSFKILEQNILGLSFQAPPIMWIIGLGVLSTGIVYILMSLALRKINANVYSLVDIIVSPMAATIFAIIILKEYPHKNMIYGGAILLLSAFWLTTDLSKGNISQLQNYQRYFDKFRRNFLKEFNGFLKIMVP